MITVKNFKVYYRFILDCLIDNIRNKIVGLRGRTNKLKYWIIILRNYNFDLKVKLSMIKYY